MHGESASLMKRRREISEKLKEVKNKDDCRDVHKQCKDTDYRVTCVCVSSSLIYGLLRLSHIIKQGVYLHNH